MKSKIFSIFKILFLSSLLAILLPLHVKANDEDLAKYLKKPEKLEFDIKKYYFYDKDSVKEGSDLFKYCQRFIGSNFLNKNPTDDDFAPSAIGDKVTLNLKEILEDNINNQDNAHDVILKNYMKRIGNELVKYYLKCAVLKSFIQFKPHEEVLPLVQASVDQKFVCKTQSLETQDWGTCTAFINSYDAASLAQGATNTFQQVDNQLQNAKSIEKLTPDNPTGGLEIQKDNFARKKNYMAQRAGLSSAKVAVLFNFGMNIPDRKELRAFIGFTNEAESQALVDKFDYEAFRKKILNAASEQINNNLKCGDSDCNFNSDGGEFEVSDAMIVNEVESATSGYLLVNQHIKQLAKAEAAKNVVDASAQVALSKLYDKRAGDINDVIKNVREFDPVAQVEEEVKNVDRCEVNPALAECLDLPPQQRGFGVGGINISGGGGSYTIGAPESDPGINVPINNAVSSTDAPKGLKSPGFIPGQSVSDNSFTGRPPGAAKTKDVAPSGAGGGTSAAVSGVSLPSNPTNRSQARTDNFRADKGSGNLAYSGKGSSLRYRSGNLSLKDKVKNAVTDPFKKLFGKGVKNEVLHFRNPASKRGIGMASGSIFENIHKRYSLIRNGDRLLKYEHIDKK